MNKKIVQAVMERSKGLCEVCGSNFKTERHHIVKGRGKRKQHETVESVIALCWHCHYGTYGIHGREGHILDRQLKLKLQETYFNQGYSVEEVRVMMGGKIYE